MGDAAVRSVAVRGMNSADCGVVDAGSVPEWTPLRHQLLAEVDADEILWYWPTGPQRAYERRGPVPLTGQEITDLRYLFDLGLIQHVRRPDDWRTRRVMLTKSGRRLLARWDARPGRSAGAA